MYGHPNTRYGPETGQAQIFEDMQEVVMSVVDGYNVCLMVCGALSPPRVLATHPVPCNTASNALCRPTMRELCSATPTDRLSTTAC